jgi:hypothetical protein
MPAFAALIRVWMSAKGKERAARNPGKHRGLLARSENFVSWSCRSRAGWAMKPWRVDIKPLPRA